LVLGLAGSYLDGDAWLDRADTEYTLTGWTVSPYVSYRSGRWFADALYAFSKVDLDLRRHTGAGGTARGSTGSDVHTFSANTGWDLVNSGGVHTGPIAGLDYLSGDLGGYHETGSARGAVKVEGQNFDSLISRLGWQLSYRVPTPVGVLTPQVRAEWAHEYLARAERVEAWLRQSPYSSVSELGSERVGHYKTSARTGATDRDTARVGAGMLMEFGRAAALLLDYEADLADADGVAQRGSLTLSLRF
jgi:outer membrane autotransporter protein